MIELGSDPEMGEILNAVAMLAKAVEAQAEVQATHTVMLRRILDATEKEPAEGEPLREVIARNTAALETQTAALDRVVDGLGGLGGVVATAVARGLRGDADG